MITLNTEEISIVHPATPYFRSPCQVFSKLLGPRMIYSKSSVLNLVCLEKVAIKLNQNERKTWLFINQICERFTSKRKMWVLFITYFQCITDE